jgi:hypothetical protein
VPRFGPIARADLIRYLRHLRFAGPYAGTKHQFMERGDRTVRLPNPHRGDISRPLLAAILREAGITKDEWEKL